MVYKVLVWTASAINLALPGQGHNDDNSYIVHTETPGDEDAMMAFDHSEGQAWTWRINLKL
jgi:hypothetical protein